MRGIGTALLAVLALAGCTRGGGDPAAGKRIATIAGCISCHDANLAGHLFEENPQFAIAWSSNLSRILPRWSDAQIEATLRTGQRPDGSALWFMPTFAHQRLSARDMRDLIAWLRSVPPTGRDRPAIVRGPQFAVAQKMGFTDSAAEAARLAKRVPAALGAEHETGRYLAQVACAECHGPDLKGPKVPQPGAGPNLAVAARYDPAQFARLLRDGIKRDGTPAVLMNEEAPKRLRALTPAEVGAIRGYLVARAGR